jgi:glycosyltransferase involved in cell wall biosynthesis
MTDATAPVSVIIPCFVCQDTIERAVLSVLRQTVLPREILLVDDASPDDGATVRELRKLAEKHGNVLPIKVVHSSENGGPGSARNLGWELACQPYIAFLDADDVWFPQKIEYQYTWMRAHPEYVLTCHQQVLLGEEWIAPIYEQSNSAGMQSQNISKRKLLYFNLIATRTVMLRRDQQHRFVEGKRYSEDYLLWLTIVLNGACAAKLKCNLAASFKPDFGVAGLSSRLIKMELGELDCYFKLYSANLIGIFSLVVISSFSLIKFSRRIFLSGVWKFTSLSNVN